MAARAAGAPRRAARRHGADEIRAACAVALVLAGAALFDDRPAVPEASLTPCAHPRERDGEGGHTRRIDCGVEGAGREVRGPARVLFGLGIDPNRADAATLEALPGVGPARAAAIVSAREDGPFRRPADLLRVRGIGPVTLERARGWLAFSDPARLRGGARPARHAAEPAP